MMVTERHLFCACALVWTGASWIDFSILQQRDVDFMFYVKCGSNSYLGQRCCGGGLYPFDDWSERANTMHGGGWIRSLRDHGKDASPLLYLGGVIPSAIKSHAEGLGFVNWLPAAVLAPRCSDKFQVMPLTAEKCVQLDCFSAGAVRQIGHFQTTLIARNGNEVLWMYFPKRCVSKWHWTTDTSKGQKPFSLVASLGAAKPLQGAALGCCDT